jgi:hypothetical protein
MRFFRVVRSSGSRRLAASNWRRRSSAAFVVFEEQQVGADVESECDLAQRAEAGLGLAAARDVLCVGLDENP